MKPLSRTANGALLSTKLPLREAGRWNPLLHEQQLFSEKSPRVENCGECSEQDVFHVHEHRTLGIVPGLQHLHKRNVAADHSCSALQLAFIQMDGMPPAY
jgi:hypothetical protein